MLTLRRVTMKHVSVSVCLCLLLVQTVLAQRKPVISQQISGNIGAGATDNYSFPVNEDDWKGAVAEVLGRGLTTKAVTAAQVNGVYRYPHNEFRILALGHHKLKVQFKGQWMSITGSPHTGDAIGEASIEGNVATFIPGDTTKCRIRMTFLANKMIVQQEGSDVDCGLGANVNASGTYRRVKAGKPKFTPINILMVNKPTELICEEFRRAVLNS